jgi:hypothetical protein
MMHMPSLPRGRHCFPTISLGDIGRPRWVAPTLHWATTLCRPYASLGHHAVSPLRFIGRPRGVTPTLHWATTLGRPYASLGDHAGSPLRFIGRPRGVTLTLHWATTLGRPYAYPRTHVPCGHDISCPCIDAPVIFATGDYLCTIHVQFSLRGLPDS